MWNVPNIFDASPFVPRGSCGHWDALHESVYFWSNLGIFAEYLVMPILAVFIAVTILRGDMERFIRHELVSLSALPLSLAMGAFVVMCGVGHALDGAGSFYWPAYRFFAWWHFATFLVGLWSMAFLARIAAKQVLLLDSAIRSGPKRESPSALSGLPGRLLATRFGRSCRWQSYGSPRKSK